ncbi:putative glyoxalase superfamily protein PhnB [Stackebrandtia albiflava]|uniref:Putative glyoxalase superfamily protein PhnB n=1 Tax=Stackebrandtia albiflava TaxID=406432 RepID=A0A562VDD8_9ACTN|nr:VOC family protein [Stackebrandtia albiflava]TWJ15882.1 putative glyoxalase superfamily protein PhnB [Stackebrandtia albiflava]
MPARLTVIEIITADLAASLSFYRRLGLDIPEVEDDAEHVETDAGGVRLSWDSVELIERINPRYVRPAGGPRVSLAFECADAAEVDRLYGELVAAGGRGEMAPFDAEWGPRYAVLFDPDGNGVDLYSPAR